MKLYELTHFIHLSKERTHMKTEELKTYSKFKVEPMHETK